MAPLPNSIRNALIPTNVSLRISNDLRYHLYRLKWDWFGLLAVLNRNHICAHHIVNKNGTKTYGFTIVTNFNTTVGWTRIRYDGDRRDLNVNRSVAPIWLHPADFCCFVLPFINNPTIVCLFICSLLSTVRKHFCRTFCMYQHRIN